MPEIISPISQSDLENNYPYILMSHKESDWFKVQMNLIKERVDLYNHSNRVAYVAAELAKHVGMNESEILALTMAGLLHDRGKLEIPDEIFNKSALGEDERKLVNKHVRISYEVVKPHLPLVANIIIRHHEFQERSYPRRADRELIDLKLGKMQQLLALADHTDSLLSPRPYKIAWSVIKTRFYLVNLFKDKDLVNFSIFKREAIIT